MGARLRETEKEDVAELRELAASLMSGAGPAHRNKEPPAPAKPWELRRTTWPLREEAIKARCWIKAAAKGRDDYGTITGCPASQPESLRASARSDDRYGQLPISGEAASVRVCQTPGLP
jgi:hypothetical protein